MAPSHLRWALAALALALATLLPLAAHAQHYSAHAAHGSSRSYNAAPRPEHNLPASSISSINRHVPAATRPKTFHPFYTESNLADIQWAGKNTVFILTFDGRCYRSGNGGKSWEDQHASMNAGDIRIRQMRVSPSDPATIFFLGEHGQHVATRDAGLTYYPVLFPLIEIRLHPSQPWLLSSVMTPACGRAPHPSDEAIYSALRFRERARANCYKQLFLSQDFGKTWRHLYNYVVQYDWAPKAPIHASSAAAAAAAAAAARAGKKGSGKTLDIIYATVHAAQSGDQVFGRWNANVNLVVSYDFFKTQPQLLVAHGNRFLSGENNFFFVAAADVANSTTSVRLYVSKTPSVNKEGTFKQSLLPVELTEHSYTILDSSENSVFLHVNHNPFHADGSVGHIYTSDSTGTQYSIALAYSTRTQTGKCDFAKVEALEGVFLANFVDVDTDAAPSVGVDTAAVAGGRGSSSRQQKVHTVITFNKGAMWEYLVAPEVDADGNPYNCRPENDCHLHLHGITQGYGPFYSVASATGLILATGTVGSSLNSAPGLINTYFSRDGGLTWAEIAKGSHIYEIGDHGGLIVMATDQAPTTTLYYSFNQGKSFHELRFTNTPMIVENIITEPSSTSQHFLIYGSTETSASQGSASGGSHGGVSSGVGVIVFVDFSELHTRSCQGIDAAGKEHSDYELWTPSDGRMGGACLMGHTVTYVRRKAAAECYNSAGTLKPRLVSNCACTEADFECDAGYVRDVVTKQCVPDMDAEAVQQESAAEAKRRCELQSFYRVTKGYRRVPGNTCIGGQEWEALVVPCPSGWLSASHSPAVILLLVFVVAFAAIFVFRTEYADEVVQALKKRFGVAQGYFKVGLPGSAPASMVDDDEDDGATDPLFIDESDAENARAFQAAAAAANHSRTAAAAAAASAAAAAGSGVGPNLSARGASATVTTPLGVSYQGNPVRRARESAAAAAAAAAAEADGHDDGLSLESDSEAARFGASVGAALHGLPRPKTE